METRASSEPFRHWIIDDWGIPVTEGVIACLKNWMGWEVAYDNDVERGKKTSRSFDQMPTEIRTPFLRMRHPDIVRDWAIETDIPSLMDDPDAHGAGLHHSENGSYLQVHVDYELHPRLVGKERRLNLLFFLHPVWKPEWGGQLLLCNAMGKSVVEIDPLPGRLVVFECGPGSYHGVRVIRGATVPRLSCAVYYLANARSFAFRRRALYMPNRSREGERVPTEVL